MAQQQQVYHVKVNAIFMAANEMFYPSHDYWVSPEVYNGKTADGRDFKDLCESATAETVTVGA
jgi:hypothetical protein